MGALTTAAQSKSHFLWQMEPRRRPPTQEPPGPVGEALPADPGQPSCLLLAVANGATGVRVLCMVALRGIDEEEDVPWAFPGQARLDTWRNGRGFPPS